LFDELAGDLGGADALTATERNLLLSACRLMVRGERAKSADDAVRCTNASARLLATLRNGRRKPARPASSSRLFNELLQRRAERHG
jgi:hypothetical protein